MPPMWLGARLSTPMLPVSEAWPGTAPFPVENTTGQATGGKQGTPQRRDNGPAAPTGLLSLRWRWAVCVLCGARRARHAGAVPSTDPPLDPPRLDVPMGATSGASVKLRTISMMMLLRTPSSSALQLTSSTVAPRLGSTMALSSSAATKGTRMAGGVARCTKGISPL